MGVLAVVPEGDEQGGEKCQGGGPVTQQTSELTPSQLHSYLNVLLPYCIGSKDIHCGNMHQCCFYIYTIHSLII